MLMYVAIAVLLIAVLILFLPSRKNKSAEGSQQNEDTVKNKKAKKVDKSLKEKRVKESPRKQKKTKVNPRFAKKQGNVDDIPDLDDAMLNLGAEVQEMQQLQEDASAPAESKQSTYGAPAESMHNAPEVEQSAEMAKEPEADSKPKKPRFKQKKEEEIKEVKSAPAIQMTAPEDEPVMHSNRVRKKLVTEDPNKNKQEVVTGISFTGVNDGLEATGVDDLFADPELSEENYKKMLFEATEDVNLTDNGISGVQAVPEEIEQVSADLEPIAAPTKEQVEESTESETKNALQESLDETTTAVDNAGIEPSTVTEEEQPAESSIATEPAETTEEVKTVDETDTNEESIAPIEPTESAEPDGPTDDFVPGSVSLLKSAGLKFRKRESTVKASEALPTDFVPHSNDSQVHVILGDASIKKPVQVNNSIEIYNSGVYKDSKIVPWDIRYEVCVKEGETVTVDTGVGIQVPVGYGVRIVPVENLESKFGLVFSSDENINIRDAAYSIKFNVTGTGYASYVAKNQPLVRIKVFRI